MGAAAQGHKVRLADGLQLHYQDVGTGEAVVFIHGSGPGASGHSNFKRNYPQFAAAGYRAIVPDLPGYGASDKPQTAYTLDFFVEALLGLLDALDIQRCTLVGVDGNALNHWIAPWLTSIRIPYESFGGHVVAQLQSLWSGEPTAEVRVPHELPRAGLVGVTG